MYSVKCRRGNYITSALFLNGIWHFLRVKSWTSHLFILLVWFARCLGSSMENILPQRALTVALFRWEYNLLEWYNWALEKVTSCISSFPLLKWVSCSWSCISSLNPHNFVNSQLIFPWTILCSTSQWTWSQAQFFTSFLPTVLPLNFIWLLSLFYHFQWFFPS